MMVFVVGSGKLAQEILSTLESPEIGKVIPWRERSAFEQVDCVVVHAGSGRELENVIAFCRKYRAPLIDLSTNGKHTEHQLNFPLIVCPNANILLLKFMDMLKKSAESFAKYKKTILESHQSTKTSEPGTAYGIAEILHVAKDQVRSFRDPVEQETVLGIPPEYLSRHAYHKITMGDAKVSVTFETKVFGAAPYSAGLAEIVSVVSRKKLENRVYGVLEFVSEGWL